MKKIVVLYNSDDWFRDEPFSKTAQQTKVSFEDWYARGESYGVKFYRASFEWYNDEKRTFTKGWTFENGAWKKVHTPIKPDYIFDKTLGKYSERDLDRKMNIMAHTPLLNNPLLRVILNSKLSQCMLFSNYMPQTLLANSREELKEMVPRIKSKKVVMKPLQGSGGFGIYIGDKKTALKKRIPYPVLVQEFITSTCGVPGLSTKKEVSDLRLVYTDHKLVYALSRIAKKGSLFTNLHQGAHAVLVPQKKIPKSVQKISKDIISRLKTFEHVQYSLDFIFTDTGKPILVELNTTPGFDLLHIIATEKIKKRNFELFLSSITHGAFPKK